MTEKDMQTLFTAFVKSHLPESSEVYELKICKGTSLPFSQVQPHQEQALLSAHGMGLFHKITDQPWIKDRPYTFTAKKPFDCFALVGVKAFVVVWYYHKGKAKVFVKIPIDVFIHERETCGRKSLTEQRAMEIGRPILIK